MAKTLDLAIIGGGPAALSAAIYAARAGLNVTVFEKQHFGGSLTEISKLANYPGFMGPGADLATALKDQAKSAGAKLEYGTCESISTRGDAAGGTPTARNKESTVGETAAAGPRSLMLNIDGETVLSRAVLVATGSEPTPLELDTDKPIHYCALCDAPLYKGKKLLIIGGGNSAVGEAIYLADIASEVTLINRSPLRAEPALKDKLRAKKNVEIRENTNPTPELLEAADGIFVFIGKRPASSFTPVEVQGNDGYIKTDDNFMTSVPGLFAAGDVREGAVRQAITAAAEGAAAAISVSNYLKA